MVARSQTDRSTKQDKLNDERKRRELALELQRDFERRFVLEQVDVLSADFADNPEQIGVYLADLETAGLLSPADKGLVFRRLWETVGPAFADQAFGMTARALASGEQLAAEIAEDSFVRVQGDRAIVSDADEFGRLKEAATALDALAQALGLNLTLPRPELRRRPELDRIADPDVERADKTREVLDTLAPRLGVNASAIDIRVDESAEAETSEIGNYGLMTDGTVFLDPALYDPETTEGRHLLAHELVHVAQLENRLRGANDTPDLYQAEAEADDLSATFAETGDIKAPLASLAAYDRAACAAVVGGGPPPERTPTTTTERIPGEEQTTERVQEVNLRGSIYFNVDKHTLDQTVTPESSRQVLDSVSATLKKYPEITKVDVRGHASTTASYGYNQVLSQKRASMAKGEVVNRGVAGTRLNPMAFSESEHRKAMGIEDDRTQKEDQGFRRVDFAIAEVNGAAHSGPLKKVSKEVHKTPGKTIVKHFDPDGKLVKTEEVIDGEAPAGKLENEPNEPTPVAKAEAAQAKDAAAGPTGGGGCGTSGSSKETTAPEQPTPTPAPGTTEEKKAATRPRRTPIRMTPTRGKKAKTPRRFAEGSIRTVAQPKAGPNGLSATQIDTRTRSEGTGERLPEGVRAQFEQAFGQNFNEVRIHRGSAQATGIGATAFARGTDIHFAPGRFDPDSASGLAVLGHELTHIVQQRAGRVAVPQGKGTHVNVERNLEAEADLLGARAARGERVSVQGSSAGLYARAASGAADTIQYEGGTGAAESEGSGGSRPQRCELRVAGMRISAQMPAAPTSPGEVQVDFSSVASISGLTLGTATVRFNDQWEIESGKITASVAVGQYVQANDIELRIEKKEDATGKYAEIAAEVRGANFKIDGLFDSTIDLTLSSRGVTGRAHIDAACPITLGQGITVSSGSLDITLAEGGALTVGGRLTGTVTMGSVSVDVEVTATAMNNGALSGGVKLTLTTPLQVPGIEGVTIKSGFISGEYAHNQEWRVAGNLVVNVRDWVEADISASYTQGAGGEGAGSGAGSSWELSGILRQLQPFQVPTGDGSQLTVSNGQLDFHLKDSQLLKVGAKGDWQTTDFKGSLDGSFNVPESKFTVTGSVELIAPELAVGETGFKFTKLDGQIEIKDNVPQKISGNMTLICPYDDQPTFELKGTGLSYVVADKKASGSTTVTTLRDLAFGDPAAYNAIVKQGTTGTLEIADNKLVGIQGGVAFEVLHGASKLGNGTVDIKFTGPSSKLDAVATFQLTAEEGIGIPDSAGPVKLLPGGEFKLSIEGNELGEASVKNLNFEVKQQGEGATGKIAGTFNGHHNFKTAKLTANGDAKIKGEWLLAPADGVSIKLKEGGKIDVAITDNKLTRIKGDFEFDATIGARDRIPEIKLQGRLNGDYSDETGKFGGELEAQLNSDLPIPMGEGGVDRLDLKSGAKFKATVVDSKPGIFEISVAADYHRAGKLFLQGNVEKAKYDFTNGNFDFKGDFTLKQRVEKSTDDNKWKFVVNPETQVGVEVESSQLKVLTGNIHFEVHDAQGPMFGGDLTDARIDVEKLIFDGKLTLKLLRDVQYPRSADGSAEAATEGQPPVSLVAKKDVSEISGTLTKNALTEITAKLNFGVKLGGEEYGSGDLNGKLDLTQYQFTGSGKVKLDKDLLLGGNEVNAAGEPVAQWILAFPAGQGLEMSIKQNILEEAQIDLGAKLYHNAEEVANGSAKGRYKLGDGKGFNGDIDVKVIKNLDWSNEGRWHYWVEQGSHFKGVMTSSKVESIDGSFSLLMKDKTDGNKDAVRVTFTGAYTPAAGFDAKGGIAALCDVRVGDGTEYKLFIAQGSAGDAVVKGQKVERFKGDITLNVKKGDEPVAKGEFKLDYNAGDENAKIDAVGKVDLYAKVEVGDAGGGDWKFFLVSGSKIDFSLTQNELDYIKGQIGAEATFKGGPTCVSGSVKVDYVHREGRKLDAEGNIQVLDDIIVGDQVKGAYKIDIKKGDGANFDVKGTKLKTIGGTVNILVRDTAPLLKVALNGQYDNDKVEFTGQGEIELLRKIEVGQSPDGVYKFNLLEGTGAKAKVDANQVTELKGRIKGNVEKEGEFATLDGEVEASKTGEQWKISTRGSDFKSFVDKVLPVVAGDWKVKVLAGSDAKVKITDNAIEEIWGDIKVQIDKGEDFSAEATLNGRYTPSEGFNGEATGKLLKDLKVRDPNPYGFWALKDGTEAKFTVANSAVDKIGGKVNFKVTEGEEDFIKGSATIDYDFQNRNLVEAKGDGELCKDKTLGTYSGFTLLALKGSKANFLAQQNELKNIGGELKLRVDEGSSPLAEGNVKADFDVKSSNFSGKGNVNLIRDYAVGAEGLNGHGQPESWGLAIKQGGGLDVEVKDNVFVECKIDVEAVGYHNGKAKADGKISGMYKAGNPEGFTGSVTLNVSERIPLLEGSGRFDYHIDVGTGFKGEASKGSIQSATVTAVLIATEGGTDKIELTGTATFAKGQGVDGGLKLRVLTDILIKEASSWKIWLAQDSGGNASVKKSALESVDGTLKLRVDKGDEKFAVGDFTAQYDLKDGTNAKVNANGTVNLVNKVDITPAGAGDFKVYVSGGSGIKASVKDSELDFIDGQIKGELHYKAQHMADFELTGKYQSLGTPDFTARGKLETVNPIEIIEFKGYKLFLGKGANITGSVKNFALEELTANIPLELQKSSKVVVKATLSGFYKHAEKVFDGTGGAEIVNEITVAENVPAAQKSYSFFVERGGSGITTKIDGNDLKELTGTLVVTVSDGGADGKFLEATATATYKSGDPSGTVTATGSLEIIRDTEMLTTTAGYSAWLKKGTGATIKLTDNKLDEIGGTIECAVRKPADQDFATIKLNGTYTQSAGFKGSGEAELKQDYKVVATNIGADVYSLWVLKGTGANIELENSDIKHIGGKVHAVIRDTEDASGDFIKIEAQADYDFPGKVFSGNGSGEVCKDKKLAASAKGEELWLAKGTGIKATVTNNALQQVGGQITLKLKDAEGFYLEGTLDGSFDAAGGTGFTGKASIKITRDKKLGEIGNYKFFLSKEGGATGATAHIDKNELTKVDGNVPFKVYDEMPEPLIKGQAKGVYDAKTQLFSGDGAVYLGRDVEYPLAGGKLVFLKGSGGGGEVKDNKLEKLTGILKVDIHDSKGPFVHAEADGEFNAVTKTIVKMHGQAKLLRVIEVGSPPAVRIKSLQGDVWVENNEVKKIEGELSVELPSLSKNGAKAEGKFQGGWEKTASEDVFWGKGEIDFTVFKTGDRSLAGKAKGEYNRDKTFKFEGELTYVMNPNLSFAAKVGIDQNLDPVVGAKATVRGIKLAEARDLFKWSKDFALLNGTAMAGPVPIAYAGGVGVGIGLALKQTTFGASIAFEGWKPISAPGNVPDFNAEMSLQSGVQAKAAVKPWLTFGIGVGGLVSAGLGIQGEAALTVDLNLNPTGRLWGKAGKYGGELDVGLQLVGSGSLSISPIAYAELAGQRWNYEMTKLTHNLGELFNVGYNYKFGFGDQGGAATAGAAPSKSVPAAATTTTNTAYKSTPPKDPATTGGLKQPGPVKGGPDMNQGKGDGKAQEGPMAGIMEKLDQVQKAAAAVGRIAKIVGEIVTAISWGAMIPQPFGAMVAGGYLAYKHFSGDINFGTLWSDIQEIWTVIQQTDPNAIRKLLPSWLTNIYDKINGKSIGQLLGDAVGAIVGWIKRQVPSWAAGAIDTLGNIMEDAGAEMVRIWNRIKNGFSGIRAFAQMLIDLGGAAWDVGTQLLSDAAGAVVDALNPFS